MMQSIEVEVNLGKKNQGRGRSQSSIRNCKYCGKSHDRSSCPAFGKECSKCGKRTILKLCVKVMVLMTNETKTGLGLRKARRAKSSMKSMNQKTMVWVI